MGDKITIILTKEGTIGQTITNFIIAGVIRTMEEMDKARLDLINADDVDLVQALLSSHTIRSEAEKEYEYHIEGQLGMN